MFCAFRLTVLLGGLSEGQQVCLGRGTILLGTATLHSPISQEEGSEALGWSALPTGLSCPCLASSSLWWWFECGTRAFIMPLGNPRGLVGHVGGWLTDIFQRSWVGF